MSTTFNKFDNTKTAFINPQDDINFVSNFPEICISTFSKKIIDQFSTLDGVTQISFLTTAGGDIPIYKINYEGTDIAFYMSRMGAPACVSGFEDIIAMGAKKFVLFGSCGVLDKTIVDGQIIVPVAAIRDEGTSYHYVEKSDEIKVDPNSVEKTVSALIKYNHPYVMGKTWTTDAIYRETIDNIKDRKECGCIVVEMECASMLAVSQFRGIPFAQFLYAADNLDAEVWEVRGLNLHGITYSKEYMKIAFEIGLSL